MGLEEQFEGNAASQWGEEYEAHAIGEYITRCVENPASVNLVGFIPHPEMAWLGGSPDFLVGDKGMGEVKCPYSQVVYPEVPPYYMAQMQGLMEITQRDYCEFVVWTPDIMAVTRIDRSKEYWDWLHLRLADFWCWVVAQVEPPREKKSQPPKLELTATTLYKLKD